jgi:molybdopterin/thiamine biosynthesis adenylyltransferase
MSLDREALQERIRRLARIEGDAEVILVGQVHGLAVVFECSARDVELAALDAGVVPSRYIRNIGTLGIAGQASLLRSAVAVVGLGGLGGYVTEALARMGVGQLILIDGDIFEEHNLNRQLLSSERRLGSAKTLAAEDRIPQINAAVDVITHPAMLAHENAERLLAGADVVVDALDRLSTRLVLQERAQTLGIPMVHGSIAGFLGQVMTVLPGDPGLCLLYGDGDLPEHGLEVSLGTPAATPMAVAAWEAQEVVKLLTGKGDLLRGRLLVIDMGAGTVDILHLSERQP